MIAVVAYPVVFASINNYNSPNNNDPFFCAPLIPCQKPPSGSIACTSNCTVILSDATFVPGTVNASLGATVTWINKDGFSHTVTAFNESAFSSQIIPPGHVFKLTISDSLKPGSYYYYCEVHPFMIGLLNVLPT